MKWILVFSLFFHVLFAEKRVECITNFPLKDIPVEFSKIREAGFGFFERRATQLSSSLWNPEISKILLMNHCIDPQTLSRLPWRKMVLFVWEPVKLPTIYYAHFSRIYTWDDDLIDNVKFFKFYYPYLMPMERGPLPFAEKKLCALIASNWTGDRINIVQHFKEKAPEDLDIYGHLRRDLEEPFQELYRGVIPGSHSGEEKRNVLQNYRFCLCFENSVHFAGYITEKIFNCFSAGCIPIYWGAHNIREYIPRECFIDFREFLTFEDLHRYLANMSEETHLQYLEHIQTFLQSDEAKLFSPEYFEEVVLEAVMSP